MSNTETRTAVYRDRRVWLDAPASVSPVIEALDFAIDALRGEYPELPPITVVTASGMMGRGKKWGHFTLDQVWRESSGADTGAYEILIASESFARPAAETFGTLVHECVHAINRALDINDTSRGNRYHNRKFADRAEDMGLKIDHHDSIGWSLITIPQETQDRYADLIARIDSATRVYRADQMLMISGGMMPGGALGPVPVGKPTSRNNPKLTCACDTPRIIRASAATLALGSITCGVCGEEFEDRE